MDHLNAIRIFQRIAETQSFTKASAQLGIPRSTVSKSIRDLEHHLTVRLLHRTTRALTLTAEGQKYYHKIVPILAQIEATEAEIREASHAVQGKLRIDIHSSMAQFVFIPALQAFRQQFPHIQLAIGVSDRPVNLIEDNVDCVIRAGQLADSSLIARTLYYDDLITCASPSYLEQYGTPESVSALAHHQMVGYFSAATGELWPIELYHDGLEQRLSHFDLSANDSASQITMMVNGLGIGQTHASVAEPLLKAGKLVEILQESTQKKIPISVIYHPTNQLNKRLRLFIDWLVATFSTLG